MAKFNDYIAHHLLFRFSPALYRRFWKKKLGVSASLPGRSARYTEKEIALLPLLLNKDSVFFDVGANMGLYLFWAETLGVTKAVGFEPIPFLHKKLQRIFPGYTLENMAVSSAAGEVVLRVPRINRKLVETRATLLGRDETSEFDECVEIHIPGITLDAYCRQKHIYPDFVKVDIEGAEERLLMGCTELFTGKRPVFMIEIEQRHNKNMDQTLERITRYGYACFHFSPRTFGMVPYLTHEGLQETRNEKTMAYVNNFIFIPEEKTDIIEKIKGVQIL